MCESTTHLHEFFEDPVSFYREVEDSSTENEDSSTENEDSSMGNGESSLETMVILGRPQVTFTGGAGDMMYDGAEGRPSLTGLKRHY